MKQPARIEMIENEMAKLVNALPGALQLLLVAELGQPFLVSAELTLITHPASFGLDSPWTPHGFRAMTGEHTPDRKRSQSRVGQHVRAIPSRRRRSDRSPGR